MRTRRLVATLLVVLGAVMMNPRAASAQIDEQIQDLISQGRYDEAETVLKRLAGEGSVRALLLLARLESGRGQGDAALGSLRRALELAPNSEEVLSAFARVQLASRSPGPAILALEALVRMHPAESNYAYLLGVARLQVGELGDAVPVLEIAAKLDPKVPRHHLALGLALNRLKRYDEAAEALEMSLQLDPDNVEATAALSEAEQGLDRPDDAERHARRALATNPKQATAQMVLGLLAMQAERYAEARDAFESVLAIDADAAKAHYQLSLAYARLGDREASRRHVELYQRAQKEAEERLVALRRQQPLVAPDATESSQQERP